MKRALLVLGISLSTSSCFSVSVEWERVEPPEIVAPDGSYRVELPTGWARAGGTLTRDGGNLQTIGFGAYTRTKIKESPGTEISPEGVYEAMEERLSSNLGVVLLESGPATMSGRPALRLHTTEEGSSPWWPLFFEPFLHRVRVEHLLYFLVADEKVYYFSYQAPALHYFARDLPAFERMVASFELLDPGDQAVGAPR